MPSPAQQPESPRLSGDPRLLLVVGAGAAARALAASLARAGQRVRLHARRPEAAAELARSLRGEGLAVDAEPDLAAALTAAPDCLLAVSDDALGEVAAELAGHLGPGPGERVALHCSGFHGRAVLAPLAARGVAVGVLHPLLPFPPASTAAIPPGTWFTVHGDGAAVHRARQLIARLEGQALELGPPADTRAYHAGAALLCNGAVALFDAALGLLERGGAPSADARRALAALLAATVEPLGHVDPRAALTGPVARGEAGVVAGHLDVLRASPDGEHLLELYRALAHRMVVLAVERGTLDAAARRAIEELLRG